jgi:hypothetical protein
VNVVRRDYDFTICTFVNMLDRRVCQLISKSAVRQYRSIGRIVVKSYFLKYGKSANRKGADAIRRTVVKAYRRESVPATKRKCGSSYRRISDESWNRFHGEKDS